MFFLDYPWAGSLRPVSNKLKREGGRGGDESGASPWSGSLRHVDGKNARRKKQQKEQGE